MTSTEKDFYIIDWNSKDEGLPEESDSEEGSQDSSGSAEPEEREFVIWAYGMNKDGVSASIKIKGFKPFFYVHLPDEYRKGPWNTASARQLVNILEPLSWRGSKLDSWEVVQSKPFYGFTGDDKQTFLKLTFNSEYDRNKWSYIFKRKIKYLGTYRTFSLYESNIPSLLRFIHISGVKATGWISLAGQRHNPTRETTTTLEYVTDWREITPTPGGEEREIPKLKYVAFDIEADSSHGDFPVAKKDYLKLARDIVTSYLSYRRDRGELASESVINRWLQLAFNRNFNNNNIISGNIGGEEKDTTECAVKTYEYVFSEAFENDDEPVRQRTINKIIEPLCPLPGAGENILCEIYRLSKINNIAFNKDPYNVIKLLLDLAVSTVDIGNINVVYTKNNVSPSQSMLKKLAERTAEICLDCYNFLREEREIARLRKQNKKLRKSDFKVKLDQDGVPIKQDTFVTRLTNLYNTNLPELDGDPVIQIGSTFKKVGETDCYLKHIICLEGVSEITNHRLIEHENKDIKLPVKQLIEELARLEDFNQPVTSSPDWEGLSAEERQKRLTTHAKEEVERALRKEYKPKRAENPEIFSGGGDPVAPSGGSLGGEEDGDEDGEAEDGEETEGEEEAEEEGEDSGDEEDQIARSDPLYALNRLIIEDRIKKQEKTDHAEVIVETYKTEREVLLAWTRLMRERDPDIVIGYNIFNFDFKFLYNRAEELGIVDEFSQIGRMKNISEPLVEQKLSSSGLGDNLLHYINMTGRISIDLYKVAQASFKLDSYKLDNVCKINLNKVKNDISAQEIFIKQKGDDHDRGTIAEYCLIDCILCVRLFDKMEILMNNIGMSQVCSVPFSFLFKRGQGIKLLSFTSKITREKGYLIPTLEKQKEGADDEGYEGAVVLNPYTDIYFETVVVADFNSLYPSCMISENLSHDSYVSNRIFTMSELKFGDDGYVVWPETAGIQFDETNKYERQLLDPDSKLCRDGWTYVDIAYEIYNMVPITKAGKAMKKCEKTVVGLKMCRFAQPPDGGKSVIPTISMELLKARKETRDKQKKYKKGSYLYNIYEGLQLAYKTTGNSLYGQIGARTSAIYFKDIAACTTSTGRRLIKFSKKYIEDNYKGSKIVYGDTDSVFIKFDCGDRVGQDAIDFSIMQCTKATREITEQLKRPHNLEFEKAINPFILVSKKRYHGHYYKDVGSPEFYENSMGIVLKRRDNAPIVKHIFGGMIRKIMHEHSIEAAIKFVQDESRRMLRGEFPLDDFIISKTLKSYYKQPDAIAHNVLAQRIGKRDPGNKPRGNDRVPYAFIHADGAELQGDRIESPEYIKANGLKLDYKYYLEHQIMKPVLQIFDLVIENSDEIFKAPIDEYERKRTGQRTIFEALRRGKPEERPFKIKWRQR
jgi:DNA polymerase elongation subunit (family B)